MGLSNLSAQATADDAIIWRKGHFYLLDQRVLPERVDFIELKSASETAQAIHDMVLRGAPAIGITAAYGVVLAGRAAYQSSTLSWQSTIRADLDTLRLSRLTVVSLFWALNRMERLINDLFATEDPTESLLQEAILIHDEDVRANREMGELGAALIESNAGVITHCNAGVLATGGDGAALGVIRSAHGKGLVREVFADETRPWLQGARLTAWELLQDEIPAILLADGAPAHRMAQGG